MTSHKSIDKRTILQDFLALVECVSIRDHAVQHLTESVPTVAVEVKTWLHMSWNER